jgi:hypothetical protein
MTFYAKTNLIVFLSNNTFFLLVFCGDTSGFYPHDWAGMKDNRVISGEAFGE